MLPSLSVKKVEVFTKTKAYHMLTDIEIALRRFQPPMESIESLSQHSLWGIKTARNAWCLWQKLTTPFRLRSNHQATSQLCHSRPIVNLYLRCLTTFTQGSHQKGSLE